MANLFVPCDRAEFQVVSVQDFAVDGDGFEADGWVLCLRVEFHQGVGAGFAVAPDEARCLHDADACAGSSVLSFRTRTGHSHCLDS